jgi:hypothetical protein
LVSLELHAPHQTDQLLKLPQSQIFPRVAIVARDLLKGGDINPGNRLLKGQQELSDHEGVEHPQLCHLRSILDTFSTLIDMNEGGYSISQTPPDYSKTGKLILTALQGRPKAEKFASVLKGQFYPPDFFAGGTADGMSAVSAFILTIASYVHSNQSRNNCVALLKGDGRGSVIRVAKSTSGGFNVSLPNGAFLETTENVTTTATLVRCSPFSTGNPDGRQILFLRIVFHPGSPERFETL